MPMDDSSSTTDPPAGDRREEPGNGKRRLSLKIGVYQSPGKKARGSGDDPDAKASKGGGGLGGKTGCDPEQDNSSVRGWESSQQPSTAASSRFPTSRSSPSPSPTPSSNPSVDDHHSASNPTSSRTATSGDSSRYQTHSGPFHPSSISSSRPSMPTWRTAPNSDNEQSTANQSIPSSESTSRHQQLSISAPSRLPSPPPSFNLSSGQPLVNPPLKTQAAFVGKLYAMLEDDEIVKTGLIHWSADGTIFTCPNPTEFSKIVLPRFFKHNNWQSFVRQLNMYSFNKVNDLFATTTDPGAWEFRHPLFRRGEPQLLASIKRKTTRPSNAEGSSLASPTEELDAPKAVAGWMRDAQQASFRINSPPPDPVFPPPSTRSRPYGFNTPMDDPLSSRVPDDRRPTSRGIPWETASQPPLSARMPPPSDAPLPRYHPDPNRPALSAHRFGLTGPSGYPESPFYPQPQHSPIDALTTQVATLEDKVQRLQEVLNFERIENVRGNLDFASYLLQLTGWMGEDKTPARSDLRVLQDTLNRASGELRQKYETLMASDALATLASGERRPRTTFEPPSSFTTLGPPPTRNHPYAVGHPPRSSPRSANFPESHRLPLPTESSSLIPASVPGSTVPRHHFTGSVPRTDVPARDPTAYRIGPVDIPGQKLKEEDEPMEEIKPRTGLSSLLN